MLEAFGGPVEIDESYFWGKRKGIRGKGAEGKVAVFGILKRDGSAYAQMIANCGQAELVSIIYLKSSPSKLYFMIIGLESHFISGEIVIPETPLKKLWACQPTASAKMWIQSTIDLSKC